MRHDLLTLLLRQTFAPPWMYERNKSFIRPILSTRPSPPSIFFLFFVFGTLSAFYIFFTLSFVSLFLILYLSQKKYGTFYFSTLLCPSFDSYSIIPPFFVCFTQACFFFASWERCNICVILYFFLLLLPFSFSRFLFCYQEQTPDAIP